MYWQMVPAVIAAILGIRGTYLFCLVTQGWLQSILDGNHTLQLAEVLAMTLTLICLIIWPKTIVVQRRTCGLARLWMKL